MVDRYLLPVPKTINSMANLRLKSRLLPGSLLALQSFLFIFQLNRYNSLRVVIYY